MQSHFAVYQHKTGIMMISIDSLVGYLKRLPEDHEFDFDHMVEMLEEMIED